MEWLEIHDKSTHGAVGDVIPSLDDIEKAA